MDYPCEPGWWSLQYGVTTLWLCEEGLRKQTMLLPGLWSFVQEEEVVPKHSLWCQTLQFLPICHWCPSSCCSGAEAQREWVWLSHKSFKKALLRVLTFLPLPRPPLVFTTRSYSNLCSWQWNPGLGNVVLDLDPLLVRNLSELYTQHMGVGLPSLCLHVSCLSMYPGFSAPPTSLDECDFSNSLVVGLPYSSIFWQF